nr:hypothetical protein [Tanacetum cinerariifolium]
MANLEFCNTYNMVADLLKTEGSEGFHQIMDFLNTSHIKYALMENPTIYASLIQNFWKTVAANTLDTQEVQIIATIDGNVKLVSKASIRRHLKLEDSDGISTLPNTKIFEQLALMGIPTRQEIKVPQPSSPTHTNVIDEAASIGLDVRHGGAATTVTRLDAGQGSDRLTRDKESLEYCFYKAHHEGEKVGENSQVNQSKDKKELAMKQLQDFKNNLMKNKGGGLQGCMKKLVHLMLINGKTLKLQFKLMKS